MSETTGVHVIEANPNPQLSYDEDFAQSAKKAGTAYGELIQRILNLGLRWEPTRYGIGRLAPLRRRPGAGASPARPYGLAHPVQAVRLGDEAAGPQGHDVADLLVAHVPARDQHLHRGGDLAQAGQRRRRPFMRGMVRSRMTRSTSSLMAAKVSRASMPSRGGHHRVAQLPQALRADLAERVVVLHQEDGLPSLLDQALTAGVESPAACVATSRGRYTEKRVPRPVSL
jgi:hypothetical protein